MQKYKFRGKEIKTGKFVYGDLVNSSSGKTLINERTTIAAKYVDPETVAQLVGYDKNDKEFYSDDILIDSGGVEVVVKNLIIKYSEIGSKFDFFKLKEN